MDKSILSQRHWRTIGLVTLAACGLMAWYGSRPGFNEYGRNVLVAYWGFFFLFLLVTLYMVLLDFRFIRMEFKMGERALFEDTLGSEDFRKNLRAAQNDPEESSGRE